MRVKIVITIERDKNLKKEVDRLLRYLLSLDNYPDGLCTVHIEDFII